MKGYYLFILFFIFGLAIFLSDFATKIYAYYEFPFINYADPVYPYGGISIFKNFFGIECSLGLVLNKGAAWGLFSNFQVPLVILRIVVIFCLLIYTIFFCRRLALQISLICIIAGALGNIVDFFIYGYVIDFIHFKFWGFDFPVFNLADTYITIGVGALFLINLFSKKPILKKYDRSTT